MSAEKYDRISSLPDAILVDILSLITLNDAVNTSFVSRRWLHLWAEVTTIYILIKQSKGPFKYWTSFPKKILPNLTSPLIRRFCLDIECIVNKYGLEQIDLWFNRVSDRWKIEEIKVTTKGYDGLISFPVIFQIHSLLVLELYGDLSLNLPLKVFKIPNLKKLAIQINFTQTKQCKFFESLMKSCPLLEDLCLHFCSICKTGFLVPNKISLLSPNLKKLNLSFSGQYLMRTIVIDAPNLEYLKLGSSNNGLPNFSFVNTPTMLVEANISGNLSKGEVTTKFFDAISRVRSLGVWRPMMIGSMTRMFVNLTRLVCTMPCSGEDTKAFLGLLEKCPLLETLTVNFTSSGTWEYLRLLCYIEAPNILIHAKKIEMNFMSSLMLNNDVLNLIKYLLTHARVLDRFIIKISTDPSGEILEEEKTQEVEACKEIFDWVRFLSTRYQVEFSGRYLRIKQSGEECKLIKGPNGYIICK
uniref:F-box domain-containing protein n=1 Tax=Chenopodium quinoa TaxID=63459 RepID=A0A803LUD0_CHEQI